MKHLYFIVSLCLLAYTSNAIDRKEKEVIDAQLSVRKAQFTGEKPDLLKFISRPLPQKESEALRFLTAYMPLSDLTMHTGSYVHEQVKASLDARNYFSWGKTIPDAIFNHFVLPYRINNEYTDDARKVFFAELKGRIKGMSMHDAALEVNHWCHEKVTYRGTDERTSGPLTAVRTAFGRCGEESTFTVAALRAVSIPARQVYTPRWAHTDDNHAWVEVWIDGKWHFMGACEPEAELDLGWFASPVKRAMMTHTVVFGRYQGKEEVLEKEPLYTRVNLLGNYTNTRIATVKVVDEKGLPMPNTKVEYMIYNYAEFYPIATKYTNAKGISSVVTGYGDLIAWGSKGESYGYSKISGDTKDTIKVVVSRPNMLTRNEELELVPPRVLPIAPSNPEKAALNNERLHKEDSIRNSYVGTFIDSAAVAQLAASKNIDNKQLQRYFKTSRGNWPELKKYILSLTEANKEVGLALLETISEKDFHDITADVLNDHIYAIEKDGSATELVRKYVWGLRVGREFVTNWRSFLQANITAEMKKNFSNDPTILVSWIKSNIKLDTLTNYYNVALSPEVTYRYRVADKYSRNLFFVAVCRSIGIPARFEPATLQPQFANKEGQWLNAPFEKGKPANSPKGSVVLTNSSADPNFIPKYYSHFTIAKLQQGQFATLDYEGSSEVENFPCTLKLDTGFYRIMTGNRQNDGSVLCNISYFSIGENQSVTAPISLTPFHLADEVLGKAEMDVVFTPFDKGAKNKLSDYNSSKGLVVAVIDPDKEPTKHLIEDLKVVTERLNSWGGNILLIVKSGKLTTNFNPKSYVGLPKNVFWGYDATGDIGNAVDLMCGNNGGAQAPQVSVISSKDEIIYYSEGYSIGLGETILKNLHAR